MILPLNFSLIFITSRKISRQFIIPDILIAFKARFVVEYIDKFLEGVIIGKNTEENQEEH